MSGISRNETSNHDGEPTPPVASIQGLSSNTTQCSDITSTSLVQIGTAGSSEAPIEIGQPTITVARVLRLVSDDACGSGNDSDGKTGPHNNNVEDVTNIEKMEEEKVNVEIDNNRGGGGVNNANNEPVPSEEQVSNMKAVEMRK